MIDVFAFPTVQLSVEKRLTDHFSVNLEAGYEIYEFRRTDTVVLNSNGFKINIEGRYYFSSSRSSDLSNPPFLWYMGLRAFYRQNQYTAGVSYYTSTDSTHLKFDDFGVKKSVIGLNLTLGFEQSLSRKIIVDVYWGIGGMYRNVVNIDRRFNNSPGSVLAGTDLSPLFQSLNLSESSGFYLNVLFGVRIGLKL